MLQCKIHKNLSHLLTVILFPGQSSQMEEYTNKLHEWSYANNMQINKQKTKEMIITTSCTASVPLYPDIQRVETFKILSIVVSNNLKWNPHIAYITHKAHWRLHLLRQLKRATVPHHDTLHFYIAVIHRSNSSAFRIPCSRLAHWYYCRPLWSTWNSTKVSTTYHIW